MSQDTLQKAENLWFSPDVVILRADTRIFRVFAAILKAQSSVFADMFTFPQPPSADMETMDGFPVVKLHDDPEEVDVFLKAIFDSSFFMPHPAETKFETILGILRLSHKYDVPYLRRALQHLEPIYPTDLSVYDTREGNDVIAGETALRRFMTIQVATEVGALWLLPVAYHDLCKLTLSAILSTPWWNSIGEKERTACLIGHSAQIQYFPRMFKFLSIAGDDETACDDWTECNRLRLKFVNESDTWGNATWTLDAWGDGFWTLLENMGMCEDCLTDSKTMHASARQAFWAQLPTMFGLPGWEELEEMRRIALSMP